MKDCNYKPNGEVQGDPSGIPNRGTSVGWVENTQEGGMSTDPSAINRIGGMGSAADSDGESTSFGGDDRV